MRKSQWLAGCLALVWVAVGADAQSLKPVRKGVGPAAAATGARGESGSGGSTRCRSELSPDALDRTAGKTTPAERAAQEPPSFSTDPMQQLKAIAAAALQRSQAVGATRWLADASALDVDQVEAGRFPTIGMNASTSTGRTLVGDITTSKGQISSLGVAVSGNLYDGGRLNGYIQWRKDQMEAAKQSARVAQDAVVLEAITTVLERNRYRTQALVYQQHARKMGCLVEALETIVAEDRGRASELVQVRKNQATAELQRDAAVAQSRQIEIKLKRLLGDAFVANDTVSSPFVATPDLGELIRWLDRSPEVMQMKLQADIQADYARAIKDGQGPQVNWSLSRSRSMSQVANATAWQAGVTLSYNFFDAGAEKAGIQAALARAEASRSQYADFMAIRTERLSSVHDTAKTAFDRAKRYVDILRDSELLRNFTFQQWSQLGRRSLFDLMSAESDHFSLRVAYVNALYDGYTANAQLRSMAGGIGEWLQVDVPR